MSILNKLIEGQSFDEMNQYVRDLEVFLKEDRGEKKQKGEVVEQIENLDVEILKNQDLMIRAGEEIRQYIESLDAYVGAMVYSEGIKMGNWSPEHGIPQAIKDYIYHTLENMPMREDLQ